MQPLTAFLNNCSRSFPGMAQVQTIGHHIKRKSDIIDKTFNSFNYSLILSGSGIYKVFGKTYEVTAPCVITQWPHEKVYYAPYEQWEECYFIYPAEVLSYLLNSGLVSRTKPVWYLDSINTMRLRIKEITECCKKRNRYAMGDYIDRLCEITIMETYMSEKKEKDGSEGIEEIRDYVNHHYLDDLDFDELAREARMSASSFRRHWGEVIGKPPARYVMELKIQHACQLLVETDNSIAEIANALKFQDPLYFSRKFRQDTGMTATDYRHKYQTPIPEFHSQAEINTD